jgi:hypothetical protein
MGFSMDWDVHMFKSIILTMVFYCASEGMRYYHITYNSGKTTLKTLIF